MEDYTDRIRGWIHKNDTELAEDLRIAVVPICRTYFRVVMRLAIEKSVGNFDYATPLQLTSNKAVLLSLGALTDARVVFKVGVSTNTNLPFLGTAATAEALVASGSGAVRKEGNGVYVMENPANIKDEVLKKYIARIRWMYTAIYADFTFREFLGLKTLVGGTGSGKLQVKITDDDEAQQMLIGALLKHGYLEQAEDGAILMAGSKMLGVSDAVQEVKFPGDGHAKLADMDTYELVLGARYVPEAAREVMGATPFTHSKIAALRDEDEVASGAYGSVFAYPPGNKTPANPSHPDNFMIKRQNAESGMHEVLFESAVRESGLLARNVMRVLELFVEIETNGVETQLYTKMPRAHASLHAWMGGRKGWITEDKMIDMARQMLMGLAMIHALGFVHGDIKRDNIFVSDGPATTIMLGDFGLAHALSQQWVDYDTVSLSEVFEKMFADGVSGVANSRARDKSSTAPIAILKRSLFGGLFLDFRNKDDDEINFSNPELDPTWPEERKLNYVLLFRARKTLNFYVLRDAVARKMAALNMGPLQLGDGGKTITMEWEQFLLETMGATAGTTTPKTTGTTGTKNFAYPYFSFGIEDEYPFMPIGEAKRIFQKAVEEDEAERAAAVAAAAVANRTRSKTKTKSTSPKKSKMRAGSKDSGTGPVV